MFCFYQTLQALLYSSRRAAAVRKLGDTALGVGWKRKRRVERGRSQETVSAACARAAALGQWRGQRERVGALRGHENGP